MSIVNFGIAVISNVGTPTNTTAAASTTSATALAANSARKRALIYNPATATATVYIFFGTPATVAGGYPLGPGQGWIEGDAGIYTGVITCITASGNATLQVTEWA